jgi:hypothetical protein
MTAFNLFELDMQNPYTCHISRDLIQTNKKFICSPENLSQLKKINYLTFWSQVTEAGHTDPLSNTNLGRGSPYI